MCHKFLLQYLYLCTFCRVHIHVIDVLLLIHTDTILLLLLYSLLGDQSHCSLLKFMDRNVKCDCIKLQIAISDL